MACYKIFEALGDPTRLAIVERLSENGPMPTVELVSDFGMTRQAATKHLLILENAGIVRSETRGRVILRKVEPEAMREAKDWIDKHAEMWSRKLDTLATFLNQ
jgi:DNA-binding transcriptional ArsR family regulator